MKTVEELGRVQTIHFPWEVSETLTRKLNHELY